jgi:vancomycin resistance protein VanJ
MDTIRIVTWNVHGYREHIPEFRSQLTALAPDIVCLQEANHEDFRECLPDAEVARGGEIMTLVRGEVISSRRIRDEEDSPWFRSPVEARVALAQGELTVLNVHLCSYRAGALPNMGTREHAKQFTEEAIARRGEEAGYLFQRIREVSGPKVVAGDLNLPPRGRLYGSFSRLLTDAFAASGNGFGWTFPQHRPLWRIDFVWTSAELDPLDCKTLPIGPSDHRPVVADLQLR